MSFLSSLGLGAASSLLNGIGQGLQFNAQKKLLKQQYEQNLDMWNKQNEYNSPVNQMARLKSAGLNPNLVYDSGNVTGNTTSDAPQIGVADAPNYAESVNQGLQTALLSHQMRKLNAETGKTTAETETEGVRRALVNYQYLNEKQKFEFNDTLFDTNVEYHKKNLAHLLRMAAITEAIGKNTVKIGEKDIQLKTEQIVQAYQTTQELWWRTRLTREQFFQAVSWTEAYPTYLQNELAQQRASIQNTKANTVASYAHADAQHAIAYNQRKQGDYTDLQRQLLNQVAEFRYQKEKLDWVLQKETLPDVINDHRFKSFSAKFQAFTLRLFGVQKAFREAQGTDWISQLSSSFSWNLGNILGMNPYFVDNTKFVDQDFNY